MITSAKYFRCRTSCCGNIYGVAQTAVDRATFVGEMPEPKTYTLNDSKSRALNFKASGNDPERDYVVLYSNDERAPGDPRGQQFINSREGATYDGWYEFAFDVESKGRGTLADELREQKRVDYQVYCAEDLHRFEIYLTAPNANSQIQTRPRHLVVAIDLPDNQRQVIKQRFWLPKGWRVEAGFGNGFGSSSETLLEIIDPDFDWDSFNQLDKREQRSSIGKIIIDRLEQCDAPRIVVHSATESGPHYDHWPPTSHLAVYGEPGQNVEDHLISFASRAFRRPVTREQIAPYLQLANQSPRGCSHCDRGNSLLASFHLSHREIRQTGRLRDRLEVVVPPLEHNARRCTAADASASRLNDASLLSAHVDRMLADDRSNEFLRSFVWAWLKLQNTVEMAPDPVKFYEYHRNRIGDAMVTETTAFFRHLVINNLSISNFIDSDFAIINADLGRHYGMPSAVTTTARFEKVALTGTGHRGGLLGPGCCSDGVGEWSRHIAGCAGHLDSRQPARHAAVTATARRQYSGTRYAAI